MCIYNETLSNRLECNIYEHKTWPNLYTEDEEALIGFYSRSLDNNFEVINILRKEFRSLYSSYCCINCKNPKIHYDNGFIEFVDGNVEEAMEHTEKYISYCQENNLELEPGQLVVLGESYMVLAQFSRAVEVLTEAIKKDPNNKEAYFHRSAANFELGNFDEALEDYLCSDRGSKIKKSVLKASAEFSQSFLSSLGSGMVEGAKEFLPNLLNSYFGLQQTFWYAHLNPNEAAQHFINASCEMGKCVADYYKKFNQETVDGYVDEMKTLTRNFYQLSESEKGSLMGHMIGKYGIDLFIGMKGAQYLTKYQNLKNINTCYNLEKMALSQASKEAILADSLKFAAEREKYLKNVKIHWDRQNKHVPGKHNFQAGKGTITLEQAEIETLVKKRVGTGQRVIGEFGEAGFKERVDFGKVIGEYALEIKGQPTQYLPTTKGMIIYAKDGKIHIVPSDPHAIIK